MRLAPAAASRNGTCCRASRSCGSGPSALTSWKVAKQNCRVCAAKGAGVHVSGYLLSGSGLHFTNPYPASVVALRLEMPVNNGGEDGSRSCLICCIGALPMLHRVYGCMAGSRCMACYRCSTLFSVLTWRCCVEGRPGREGKPEEHHVYVIQQSRDNDRSCELCLSTRAS